MQLDARFCDRCGNDLSTFWKTAAPLVRQISDQQMSSDEQSKSVQVLNERIRALELKLSASIPRSELDAATSEAQVRNDQLTGRIRELEAKLVDTVPRAELEVKASENETLRNEFSKLKESKIASEANITRLTKRLSELEGRLTESVPRSEFESNQYETKTLRQELSKLRDEKAQSETIITHLTGRVHELEAKDSETENLRSELSKLRDDKAQLDARIEKLLRDVAPDVRRYFVERLEKGVEETAHQPVVVLERKCTACGAHNRDDVWTIFCSKCGVSLDRDIPGK